MSMKVTTKGQVTIPLWLREKYNINANTEIEFAEENNQIVIKALHKRPSSSRFQKARGKASIKMTTEEIMNLTR